MDICSQGVLQHCDLLSHIVCSVQACTADLDTPAEQAAAVLDCLYGLVQEHSTVGTASGKATYHESCGMQLYLADVSLFYSQDALPVEVLISKLHCQKSLPPQAQAIDLFKQAPLSEWQLAWATLTTCLALAAFFQHFHCA